MDSEWADVFVQTDPLSFEEVNVPSAWNTMAP